MIERGLTDCDQQLAKVLDLYLEDEFPKDVLDEKRAVLEKRKADLERERDKIKAQLKQRVVTEETIQEMEAFRAQVAEGLGQLTFENKRCILEMLQVHGLVTEQGGEKAIAITGAFPEEVLSCCDDDNGLSPGPKL